MVRGNLSARVRLVVSLSAVLACAAVRAEDLDQGKSGQRLFADSCAACHKSAKGLTKRGYLTLYFFLRRRERRWKRLKRTLKRQLLAASF